MTALSAIKEIDYLQSELLKRSGIRTTEKLLEAAKGARGREALSAQTTIDEQALLRWANIADKLRIKGMGAEYAGLLCHAGVDTVRELGHRNPGRLFQSLAIANQCRNLVAFLPPNALVARWIAQAKALPQKITY